MNKYRTILTKQKGSIVECRFNRPERRNAVDGFMHQELVALFRELGTDETTNVVVLTGEGDAFCAGGDIEHMDDQFEKHEEAHPGLFRDAADLVNAILKVRQPIIAQVNGDAIGLGASLAVLSDIVMMSSTARIGDPHVRAGLVPGDGGLIAWPLLLPLNIAKELLFTGRLLSAAEAQALGLVNHVVLPENLESEVGKLAESLASAPQHALRFTKRILNKLLEDRATHALDLGLAFEAVTLGTSDHKSAVAKFVARAESSRHNQASAEAGESPAEVHP
jgi:enoyl-CoA hydratase